MDVTMAPKEVMTLASVTAQRAIKATLDQATRIHGSLGIDVSALETDNSKSFKRMTAALDVDVFNYEEVVVWLKVLSKLGKCQGLEDCAEDYARKLIDDDMDKGWLLLDAPKEYWSFMKPAHLLVLERFGINRELDL